MSERPVYVSRPATWRDRHAEYERLRSAGASRLSALRTARHLVGIREPVDLDALDAVLHRIGTRYSEVLDAERTREARY